MTHAAVLPTRVALVGMPGSGKSTVGKHLARRLNIEFVDTDALLEQRLGCSIKAYFSAHGEASFRDREEALLAEIEAWPACVVSTGGGIVLRERNRSVLRSACQVFYLRAAPEDIYRRLRHDKVRPLLQVADPLAKLREMHAGRDPLYRQVAHFVVETGRPTVNTLVNMIQMQLELADSDI